MLVGLALILGGVALGSGVWRPARAPARRSRADVTSGGPSRTTPTSSSASLDHEEVEPFLAASGPKDRDAMLERDRALAA